MNFTDLRKSRKIQLSFDIGGYHLGHLGLTAIALLAASPRVNAMTIFFDGFTTDHSLVVLPGASGNSASGAFTTDADDTEGVLGGERDVVLTRFDPGDFVTSSSGAQNFSDPNQLGVNFPVNTSGQIALSYDGLDGDAANLDSDFGLGGEDLTASGSINAFLYDIGGLGNQGGTLIFTTTVYSNSSDVSVISRTVNDFGQEIFLFSDFATSSGNGADFTSVNAIVVEIAGTVGFDATVDNLGFASVHIPFNVESSVGIISAGAAIALLKLGKHVLARKKS